MAEDRVRLPEYEKLRKQREKERKKRSKVTSRPRLKGRMRQSIAQRSMKTRTQQSVSRGIGGLRAESLEMKDNLASNDIVHTILKQLAPLNLPDHEFYGGVVVMLRWVLVGVADFFKKHAVSAKEVAELRQRFMSVFDLTRISKAMVPKRLWSWALQGPGDYVADAVGQILMRVSVSDPQFPEKCGIVVRKAVESLAKMSTISPRLVGSMFTDLLGRFSEGKIWGELYESVGASPGDFVITVDKEQYGHNEFGDSIGAALLDFASREVTAYLIGIHQIGSSLKVQEKWFFVLPTKEDVTILCKDRFLKALVPEGASVSAFVAGDYMGVISSSQHGDVMSALQALYSNSQGTVDAIDSINAEFNADAQAAIEMWKKRLEQLGDVEDPSSDEKKEMDQYLSFLEYVGETHDPDSDENEFEPEDDYEGDPNFDFDPNDAVMGAFSIGFAELCDSQSIFNRASSRLGEVFKGIWGNPTWLSRRSELREMVVQYKTEKPEKFFCWEDKEAAAKPFNLNVKALSSPKEPGDSREYEQKREREMRLEAEREANIMKGYSALTPEFAQAHDRLKKILAGRNDLYREYMSKIKSERDRVEAEEEQEYRREIPRLQRIQQGEVRGLGRDAADRIRKMMFSHPDVTDSVAKSFGMYLYIEMPPFDEPGEAKQIEDIAFYQRSGLNVPRPNLYSGFDVILSDDPSKQDYGLHKLSFSGDLFNASTLIRGLLAGGYGVHIPKGAKEKDKGKIQARIPSEDEMIDRVKIKLPQDYPKMVNKMIKRPSEFFSRLAGFLSAITGGGHGRGFNRVLFGYDPWDYLRGLTAKGGIPGRGFGKLSGVQQGWYFPLEVGDARYRTSLVGFFQSQGAKKISMKSPREEGSPLDTIMKQIAQELVRREMESSDFEFGAIPADLSYEEMSKKYKENIEKLRRRRDALLRDFVKKVEPQAVQAATKAARLPSLRKMYKSSYLGIM